jgi:hypothetical protein
MTNKEQSVNALTIVENLEPTAVGQVMQRINQFQGIIQKTLKDGHDYGVIPGTGNKPTLLKPGAEKILMLMGVTSEYELIERVQDYEQGFFAFTVKCVLSRNGQVITEGLGHCNNREKKYMSEKQDPYTLANTCLKIAKKRSQIDAVLTIASLSEVFTQDLDEMEPVNNNTNNYKKQPRTVKNINTPTEKQLKMLHAKGKELGLTKDEAKAMMQEMFGKTSTGDLTKKEASELIDYLIKLENGEAELHSAEESEEPDFSDITEEEFMHGGQ